MARALVALHDTGVKHGGLGPAAIVGSGDVWLLTDVGVAAVVRGDVAPLASTDVHDLAVTMESALSHDREPPAAFRQILDVGRLEAPAARSFLHLLENLHPHCDVLDDDIAFTAFSPRVLVPGVWYTFLAFAHKTDPFEDAGGPADPLEEVRRQAANVLGDLDDYRPTSADSAAALLRGSQLTFVPTIPGVELNPPARSFRWEEPVHREEFRRRAAGDIEGTRPIGHMSVFLGSLLIAEVSLRLKVARQDPEASQPRLIASRARPYRKIFASYAHQDAAVVDQVEAVVRALGDDFLRDSTQLRAGEVWSERLSE